MFLSRPKFNLVVALLSALFALVTFMSCGTPVPDGGSLDGQQEAIDLANNALTTGDCPTALSILTPIYNSANSDNAIRMVTASAYACDAKIDFFPLIGTIVNNASTMTSGGLWSLMAETFPSVQGQDHVVEGALLSIDALQATLKSGIPVLASDRTSDANIYLLFVSMAAIGGLESRNGDPSSSYHKQVALPWATAATMTADGCAYASAILDFIDAIGAINGDLPSNEGSIFGDVNTIFSATIDEACNIGLDSSNPAYPIPTSGTPLNLGGATSTWVNTGCTLTAGGGCPSTLRNRNSCKGQISDPNSCAAAGIINFINATQLGWQ